MSGETMNEFDEKVGYYYSVLFMVIFVSTVLIAIGFAWFAPVLVVVFWLAHLKDWRDFKANFLLEETP